MAERYRQLGWLGKNVRYNELPGVNHFAWVPAYRDAAIFKLVGGVKRDPFPRHVIYRTYSLRYNQAYWLRIDGIEHGLAMAGDRGRSRRREILRARRQRQRVLAAARSEAGARRSSDHRRCGWRDDLSGPAAAGAELRARGRGLARGRRAATGGGADARPRIERPLQPRARARAAAPVRLRHARSRGGDRGESHAGARSRRLGAWRARAVRGQGRHGGHPRRHRQPAIWCWSAARAATRSCSAWPRRCPSTTAPTGWSRARVSLTDADRAYRVACPNPLSPGHNVLIYGADTERGLAAFRTLREGERGVVGAGVEPGLSGVRRRGEDPGVGGVQGPVSDREVAGRLDQISAFSAASNRSLSSGFPTVMRSRSRSSGVPHHRTSSPCALSAR